MRRLPDSGSLSRPMEPEEARAFMDACLDPATDPGALGEALLALNTRTPTGGELASFAAVILAHARAFRPARRPLLDTCGTGGDARGGVHTANLSTLAALALAGLGVGVAKHGNRAASSRCGSADLLEALGVELEAPVSELERADFAFLFAPRFHPVMARVAPVRKALGVPTVFNLLGPLLNPARPEFQVLGVPREGWMAPMAEALALTGVRSALVVHGRTAEGLGMDEASVDGPTRILPVGEGRVGSPWTLSPAEAGLRPYPPLEPRSRQECLDLAEGLLGGRDHPAFSPRLAEEVALQAALGLLLARDLGPSSLPDCVAEARASLHAGTPLPVALTEFP